MFQVGKEHKNTQEICNSGFILDSRLQLCKWTLNKKPLRKQICLRTGLPDISNTYTSRKIIVLVQHDVLYVCEFTDEQRALELCPNVWLRNLLFSFRNSKSIVYTTTVTETLEDLVVYFLFLCCYDTRPQRRHTSNLYWLTRVAKTASGETLPWTLCLLAFTKTRGQCYFSTTERLL